MSRRHVIDSLVDGSLIVLWTWLKGRKGRSSSKGRVLLGGRRGLVGWCWYGPCFVFGEFKFLCVQRNKIFECDLLEILILEVLGVDAGSNGSYSYGVRCVFSLVLQVPSHRGNHEVISMDRPLHSSAVLVGILTTFDIGGRTDINGGAGRRLP